MTNRECYDRAVVIPGRSLTRSKAPGRLYSVESGGPLYAASGHKSVLVDVEGREYIDMVCALGAVSLGYGYQWPAGLGVSPLYSLPHYLEARAAEAVLAACAPWAIHCRFVKTGSEATHAAYRIAKAATGRNLVLVGDWAYHGWHEWCADPKFPFTARYSHRHEWGTDPLRLPFMPMDSIGGHIDGDEVAAVFVEPHRWEPVSTDWLKSVRRWCNDSGALLVFDEMIYGGRWALGGASAYFGVIPDLACYGKAIGDGAPIACVVGRDALRDHGELVSGTYSGDVPALVAIRETLKVYWSCPVIGTLWQRGQQLQAGLRAAVAETDWTNAAWVEGAPVHQRLRFADQAIGQQFAAGMAARGVLWHPEVVNVMYSHSERQIEDVVVAARQALGALKRQEEP